MFGTDLTRSTSGSSAASTRRDDPSARLRESRTDLVAPTLQEKARIFDLPSLVSATRAPHDAPNTAKLGSETLNAISWASEGRTHLAAGTATVAMRNRGRKDEMAHIEKRKRYGKITYRARYSDPDGRERSRVFARKGDAEKYLSTIEVSKIRGEWIDQALGKTTFGDYATDWFATKSAAASTMANVKGRLNKWARPFFGDMPLARVQPTHARAFKADLLGQELAPSTVKAILLTTGQVFAQAVDDGLIVRSPFAKVPMPEDREHEEQHFLTVEQVELVAQAVDDRYRAAIYLAAFGGLRAGELWALELDRVNVLAGTVEVVASASEAGGWHAGPTKTGKRRTIVVPRFLAVLLGQHIGRYPSSQYVFTAAEGGPVHHRNFRRRHFVPAVARAELDGVRFHDLRHTAASLLIAAGRSLQEVKDQLGHSSIRVTSDRYAHLYPEARIAMADALDTLYREAVTAPARPRNEIASLPDPNQGRR
jgi:integrase